MNNTTFQLTEEQLSEFDKNGYIGPFTLFTPDEMQEKLKEIRIKLLDTTNSVYQGKACDSVSGNTTIANFDRHLDINLLFNHINRREIVDRVCSILGNDVLCWRTEFIPKYPGDEGTDWHQASTFSHADVKKLPQILWPEDSHLSGAINVWTAFTDASIEHGCLQFIPTTHKKLYYDENKPMKFKPEHANKIKKQGVNRGFYGYDFRQLKIDPTWSPDESDGVSMNMKPGQFIIFWSTLIHASHPNISKQMRLGYCARYVPTSVKIYPESDVLDEFGGKASLEKYRAVLVNGTCQYDYNRIIDKSL